MPTWNSLISSTDFSGIQADVTTAAVGILSVVFVIAGIGMLIRVFSR